MRLTVALLAVCLFAGADPCRAAEARPDFEIDVQAVLSKAGCNAGACHGNQNGKGGLRLSLRGQDAAFDYHSLVAQYGGRRVNRFAPEQSLLLLKPSMQVPHQGGRRLHRGARLYELLRDWIAAGAPGPGHQDRELVDLQVRPLQRICFDPQTSTQLHVEATYSDGSRRDVAELAVYEASNLNVSISPSGRVQREELGEATVTVRYLDRQVPVRLAFLPRRDDYRWSGRQPRNYVDQHVFTKLNRFHAHPAERCADHEFLRRVYLDALGRLPTKAEAQSFLGERGVDKRGRLIDQVLGRPELNDHWALKWSDLLRAEENVLDRKGVEVFHGWIRDAMAVAAPLDDFVRQLLVAKGSTYENPPTNYWRALRDPQTRGEAAARVFLGTRLQCAQCHNHPFDRWTQDDYYAWSAVFARVDYEIVENKPRDKFDKNQFIGEQRVGVKDEGEVENPSTGVVMKPKLLGADQTLQPAASRLEELASWLTSPRNRQFARAQANRIWYHLMGRGLVEPVDDFRLTNPASHPELLDALADDFVAHGFDVRRLLRVIMHSETYQLGSAAASAATDVDAVDYAYVPVRRLTAEQLLDAQAQVLGVPVSFNGHPLGKRAGQLPGVHKVRFRDKPPSAGDRFLFAFGKPERLMTCECERSSETTLSQALLLINGPGMEGLLTAAGNRLNALLTSGDDPRLLIEDLYWEALSRPPSPAELGASLAALHANDTTREGLEDVAWALLNAKEFVFRH